MQLLRVLMVTAVSLVLAGAVSAETIFVAADGSGDYPTIQAALDASVEGDQIQIGPGLFEENIVVPDRAILIRGTLADDGTHETILDGRGLTTVVLFDYFTPVQNVLRDLVITNGGGVLNGGGIEVRRATPTVINCVITGNNVAEEGSGVYVWETGNLTMVSCRIVGNNSGGEGAGLSCRQSGNVTMINCEVSGNYAEIGGAGLEIDTASASLLGTEISQNITPGQGGGLWIKSSAPVLDSCTIWGNQSLAGAGVYCFNSSEPVFENCVIANNSSKGGIGGGICNLSQKVAPILSGTLVCGNVPSQFYGDWIDGGQNGVSDEPCLGIGLCCTGNDIRCARLDSEMDCLMIGGQWVPDGTSCFDCPLIVESNGACCVAGLCVEVSEQECEDLDGIFSGDGVACLYSECVISCFGDATYDGVVDVNDILLVIARFGVTCP